MLDFDRLQTRPLTWLLFVLFVTLVIFVLPRLRRWKPLFSATLLLLILFALGMTRYAQQRLPMAIYQQKAEYTEAVAGIIDNYPTQTETHTRFLLKPDYDSGLIQVFYAHEDHAPPQFHVGDHLRLQGFFHAPEVLGEFDYPEYLAGRGIWAIARLSKRAQIEMLDTPARDPLRSWGEQTRNTLFAHIDAVLATPHNHTFKALMFGERAFLDESLEENFRDAGVAHVLAVSGLHLGILIALFWGLLRYLGFSATLTYLLIAVLVSLYLLLVGFKVSLIRAALLFGFLALGNVFKERGWLISVQIDPLQGWSAAALVILFVNPQALWDVGFQLSFAATGAILLALPLLFRLLDQRRFRSRPGLSMKMRLIYAVKRAVVTSLLISLAAQLGALPIVAIHFHKLYVGALLSNLLVVPLVTLVLWNGMALLTVLSVSLAGVTALVGKSLAGLLALLSSMIAYLAVIPGMVFDVPAFPAGLVLGYFLVLIIAALELQRRFAQASRLFRASANASVKS